MGAMRAGITWRGCRLTDKEQIKAFLGTDREYGAFALGDLDPEFFPHCTWYGAETEGDIRSLALVFRALDPPALFVMGDPTGLALMLGSLVRERNVYVTCRQEHKPVVEAYYSLGKSERMIRMVLRPNRFRPIRRHMPERLTPASFGELQELYDADKGYAAWFQPYQLAQGFFYGMRERGRLVSVAGTHLVSLAVGVAAVGNVFTLPAYRGRGYASACVSRLTEALLAHDLLVVLNVSETNDRAACIYRRLGYKDSCTFLEIPAIRRHVR